MPVSSSPATAESERWMAAVPESFLYTFRKPSRELSDTYYAFRMFGLVINETLAEQPQFNWSDGGRLGKQFCNRTIHFQSGSMFISADGERRNLMTLKQFQRNHSKCQFAFLQDPQTRTLTNVTTVQWVSGEPPTGYPRCGFENEKCQAARGGPANTALAVFLYGALPVLIFVPWWRSRILKFCVDDPDPPWWAIDCDSSKFCLSVKAVSMYVPT
ncbi:hypothetical protein RvY_06314 [Ramazzottius varieornatus]|uniref:Uncharacterized protein n=1 Tax=Ramazzottius varieornatus TaxID=947166 RepID=A0A1D1V1M8_RAMVA|nr:hypothetical protein RvY_06314 [Ramazzottius varieornatus]